MKEKWRAMASLDCQLFDGRSWFNKMSSISTEGYRSVRY